jgi:glucokinase
MCITVGTGIGAGLILGGALYRGAFGVAGEPGHMQVVPGGLPCRCGNQGCWEQYASGQALVRIARQMSATGPDQARDLLALGDGTPIGIRGRHVTQAAQAGDVVALGAFAEVGSWLGQGLADLVAVLDPASVVIGGGVSEAGQLLLDPAASAFEKKIIGRGLRPLPTLRLAEHANHAGLIGAADLARSQAATGGARLR